MQKPVILDNGNHSPTTIQTSSPLLNPTLESQLCVGGYVHAHEPLCSIKPTFQTFGAKEANFLLCSTPHISQSITSWETNVGHIRKREREVFSRSA